MARVRWGSALAVGLVLSGCIVPGPPSTRFERVAFVPMPAPSTLSQQLRGRVEVQGVANFGRTDPEEYPEPGDPALQAPTLEFGGQVRVVLVPHLTLGAQGVLAHTRFSRETAEGSATIRGQRLYGGGPNVAFHYGRRFGRTRKFAWGVGGGIALSYVSVPYAVWERDDGLTSTDYRFGPGLGPPYHVVETGREGHWFYVVTFGGNLALNSYLELFVQGSVQNALTNVGFDDEPGPGARLSSKPGIVYAFGTTVHGPGGLFVRAQAGFTLMYDQLHRYGFGPAFQLALGFDLGAAPATAERRERGADPPPHPAPTGPGSAVVESDASGLTVPTPE